MMPPGKAKSLETQRLTLRRFAASDGPAVLGMRREGHFRQGLFRENGDWWEEYFYAPLADEYFGRA
jgi:hypothetical protein